MTASDSPAQTARGDDVIVELTNPESVSAQNMLGLLHTEQSVDWTDLKVNKRRESKLWRCVHCCGIWSPVLVNNLLRQIALIGCSLFVHLSCLTSHRCVREPAVVAD